MSDIHGNSVAFEKMLKLIDFSDTDKLFIIGDIIDRGSGIREVIEKIYNSKNIEVLMGNHEDMCLNYYDSFSTYDKLLWFDNGGYVTYNFLESLNNKDKLKYLDWFASFPLKKELQVNNKTYVLGHACPWGDNKEDIVWMRYSPSLTIPKRLENNNIQYICGHTPTIKFDIAKGIHEKKAEMWKNKDERIWYIDCGAAYIDKRARLCCICLNNNKTFYVDVL